MKRLTALLVCICMLLTALPFAAYAEDAVPEMGDINGDGRVDTADVRLLMKTILAQAELTVEQEDRADPNLNGKLDTSDARLVLGAVVGLSVLPDIRTIYRPRLDLEAMQYDEVYGAYYLGDTLDELGGSLAASAKVSELTLTIQDARSQTVYEKALPVDADWVADSVAFIVGANTVTVTATAKNGTVASDTAKIYNAVDDNMNLDYLTIDTADTDGDGLNNYYEAFYGTDPDKADTDGDGLSDYDELMTLSTDPLKIDSKDDGVADGQRDFDGDGLCALDELYYGTDPFRADTDGDGLSDDRELAYQTDPKNTDTDGDGASDGMEVDCLQTDPTVAQDGFDYQVRESGCGLEVSLTVYGLEGGAISSVAVKPVEQTDQPLLSANVPGYLTNAYEVVLTGDYRQADLYLAAQDTAVLACQTAALYAFDPETRTLSLVPYQMKSEGMVTASGVGSGCYILLDRKAYEEAMAQTSDDTDRTDSNGDGISDSDTRLMCDGELLTTTGETVFGDAEYETVQASADYDGDGLLNGEELEIVSLGVQRYVLLSTDPADEDTDGDGLTDGQDAQPTVWDVCDRDLAMFAALAYEDEAAFPSRQIVGSEDEPGESYYFLDFAHADELYGYWTQVEKHDEQIKKGVNFSATVYQNGKSVVLAIRGTDSELGEWVSNILEYGLLNCHAEEAAARNYALEIAEKYRDCDIYITGHSLGGYLTQIAAAQLYDSGLTDRVMRVSYFNGMGLKFNKLIWFSKKAEIKAMQFYQSEQKLYTHRIKGDIVSALGTHYGTQIYVYEPTQKAIDNHKALHSLSLVQYLWYTHETDSFYYYLAQGIRRA